MEYVHTALSQYQCTIEDLVVQPGAAFARMTFTGVHTGQLMGYAPTDRKVSWAGAALFRFDGEKVSDLWVLGDLKDLERQLDNKAG